IAGIIFIFVITVTAQAQTTPVKEPTATISGKITLKGKGAPGVVVGLRRNGEAWDPRSANYRAVTNDDGEYRIADVKAWSYQLLTFVTAFVSSAGPYGQNLIVNKGDTIEHLDFTLVPGGVITGKVVDSDGRPVIEESVYAMPAQGKDPSNSTSNALTDDRGV